MNILSLIASFAVAAGTLALAYVASRNVLETRKIRREDKANRVIGKSPILEIKLQKTDGGLADYTDNKIRINCHNVGYGPAFNVNFSCYQGSTPVEFEPSSMQSFPLSLSVGRKITLECHWPFDLKNEEDREKPLVIESIAESIFKTKVKQRFKLPISTQGEYVQEILENIDFGV